MIGMSLDIETLGTTPRSIVLSIGATVFNSGDKSYKTQLWVPKVIPQMARKRFLDWNTLTWWRGQPQEAQDQAFAPEPLREDVERSLDQLTKMWKAEKCETVWGCGPTFDVTILETLYKEFSRRPPWGFREIRDVRTLVELTGVERVSSTYPHMAGPDSRAQAITIVEGLNHEG